MRAEILTTGTELLLGQIDDTNATFLARQLRNLGIDIELGLMSDRVIVTAEEIVDRVDWPIDVTSLRVDAVVHAPRGAWPSSCYPLYALDGPEIMRYAESCPDEFDAYLTSFLEIEP